MVELIHPSPTFSTHFLVFLGGFGFSFAEVVTLNLFIFPFLLFLQVMSEVVRVKTNIFCITLKLFISRLESHHYVA